MPVGEAALWGGRRICTWTSQVPLLFLHFFICSSDSDSHRDLLVKSSIRILQGCATDTGGVLHTHKKFFLSQRAGRDSHEQLKAELSWWTGGTSAVLGRTPRWHQGLHQNTKHLGRPRVCSSAGSESMPSKRCCPVEDGQCACPAGGERKTPQAKGCKAERPEDPQVVVHPEKLSILWETPTKPKTWEKAAESEFAD